MKAIIFLGVIVLATLVCGQVYEDRFFMTKLDHTVEDDDVAVWYPNRYIYDDEFSDYGGPILIMLGNQNPYFDNPFAYTLVKDISDELNGTLFYLEQRFYGESIPTVDLSTENLQYLTAQQYIEDIRVFIEHIKSYFEKLENSKVILTGSVYSGTIAAWFKATYPNLVDGVWASQGPLQAKLDFSEGAVAFGEDIQEIGGDSCYEAVEAITTTIDNKIGLGEFESLQQDFNLCVPLTSNNNNAIGLFKYVILVSIGMMVVSAPTSANIESICSQINVDNSYAMFTEYMQSTTGECLDVDFDYFVEFNSNSTLDAASVRAASRQLLYQECTQTGWFFTTTAENHPFGSGVPIQMWVDACNAIFDFSNTQEDMEANIDVAINGQFGGLNPDVTDIIFTTMGLNPFRKLSIVEDLHENAQARIVLGEGAAGIENSITDFDSEQMREVKELVRNTIIGWASE